MVRWLVLAKTAYSSQCMTALGISPAQSEKEYSGFFIDILFTFVYANSVFGRGYFGIKIGKGFRGGAAGGYVYQTGSLWRDLRIGFVKEWSL